MAVKKTLTQDFSDFLQLFRAHAGKLKQDGFTAVYAKFGDVELSAGSEKPEPTESAHVGGGIGFTVEDDE